MTIFSKKNFPETISFFFITGLLSYWLFRENISLFPSFIHAWTQSDRYALALGFLNNGFDFFHPQTYNLITVNGITQVDFPIHEYMVALIMKVTGIHQPIVFRLYTLCYGLTGLYFIFRLTKLAGGTFFHGLFASIFLMSCPVFIYYLDGFLPSVPSFANVMIGYFFFFRYKKENHWGDFMVAIFFFTLAALARMPFTIFLFAVCCQQILSYLYSKKNNRKEVILFSSGLVAVGVYFLYNIHLAHSYGSQFLTVLLPAKSFADFKSLCSEITDQWKFDYFSKIHYLILLVLFSGMIYLFTRKKFINGNNFILQQLWIAFGGAVIYFLLMTAQFPEHDYYFIDSFYPVVTLFLVFAITQIQLSSVALKLVSAVVACGMIFLLSSGAKKTLAERYTQHDWDRTEITRQNFTGAEHFLDSIGISKDAKMLVLDAYTTNTPLILMNRKGYTLLWTSKENIDTMLRKEFDYVVMQNSFLVSDILHFDPELISQLEKKADNGTISIYAKKEKQERTQEEFLGITASSVLYTCFNDFENKNSCITIDWSKLSDKTSFSGSHSFIVDSADEFVPTFHFVKSEIPFVKSTKIFIKARILREKNEKDIAVVASLNHGDENYFYTSFSVNQYIGNSTGWQEIMFQFVLPDVKSTDDKLSVYFWNKEKNKFYLDDFTLTLYP